MRPPNGLRAAAERPLESMISKIAKYTVEAELGRGGFGRVYRAYDPDVQRSVAIKVLTAEADPELLRRFQVEVGATGNLRHKNIVTLYECGAEAGVPYLVMELLEGETLESVIRNRKALPLLEKVRVMTQVAEGLSYAHSKGVIHRDVKPGNIMLLADGGVKIMDFGIARVTSRTSMQLTREGFIVGTIPYMSPEQFEAGGRADEQTDIFAFGSIYYEFLTGKHPFAVQNDVYATIARIKAVEPEPVTGIVEDCPEALELLVHRAVAKERDIRYQRFSEVILDSEAVLADLQHERAAAILAEVRPLVEAGEFETAEHKLVEAAELDPGNREARRLRMTVREEMQRRAAAKRVAALLEESQTQLNARQFAEAVQTLEAARRLNRDDPDVRARLSDAHAKLEAYVRANRLLAEARRDQQHGRLAEAVQRLQAALELDPQHTDAKILHSRLDAELRKRERDQQVIALAEERARAGEFDGALAALDEAGSPEAAALRARIERERDVLVLVEERVRAGRYDEALAALHDNASPRGVELRARIERERAAVVRAGERLRAGRYNEALAALRPLDSPPALELRARIEDEWRSLAAADEALHRGRYDEAITALENIDSPPAAEIRARIGRERQAISTAEDRVRSGRYDEALAVLEGVASPPAAEIRARAARERKAIAAAEDRARAGSYEQALAELQDIACPQAVELRARIEREQQALAAAREQLSAGRYGEALAVLEGVASPPAAEIRARAAREQKAIAAAEDRARAGSYEQALAELQDIASPQAVELRARIEREQRALAAARENWSAGRYDEALAVLEGVASPPAAEIRARAARERQAISTAEDRARAGSYEQALAELQDIASPQAVELRARIEREQQALAAAREQLSVGRYDGALAKLEAIATPPAAEIRARAARERKAIAAAEDRARAGSYEQALAELEDIASPQAVELRARIEREQQALAAAREQLSAGRYGEALAVLEGVASPPAAEIRARAAREQKAIAAAEDRARAGSYEQALAELQDIASPQAVELRARIEREQRALAAARENWSAGRYDEAMAALGAIATPPAAEIRARAARERQAISTAEDRARGGSYEQALAELQDIASPQAVELHARIEREQQALAAARENWSAGRYDEAMAALGDIATPPAAELRARVDRERQASAAARERCSAGQYAEALTLLHGLESPAANDLRSRIEREQQAVLAARERLREGRYDEALTALRDIGPAAGAPLRAQVEREREANELLQAGRHEDALAALQGIGSPLAAEIRGRIEHERQAIASAGEHLSAGRYDEALAVLEDVASGRAIEIRARIDRERTTIASASEDLHAGRYDHALAALEGLAPGAAAPLRARIERERQQIAAAGEQLREGRYDRALTALQGIASPPALDLRARIERERQAVAAARERLREQRYERALAAVEGFDSPAVAAVREEIERERSNAFETALDDARRALDNHQLTRAGEILERLSAEFSRDPARAATISQALDQLRLAERAEAIDAYTEQARELARQEWFRDALEVLDDALRRFPGDTGLSGMRASIAEKFAAQQRSAAIAALLAESNARRGRGELEAALAALNEGRKRFGDDQALIKLHSEIEADLAEQQRAAAALEQERRAVRSALHAAATFERQRKWDLALKAIEQALRRYPEDALLLRQAESIRANQREEIVQRERYEAALASAEADWQNGDADAAEQRLAAVLRDGALDGRAAGMLRDIAERRTAEQLERAKRAMARGDFDAAIGIAGTLVSSAPPECAAAITQVLDEARRARQQAREREISGVAASIRDLIDHADLASADAELTQARSRFPEADVWSGLKRDLQQARDFWGALERARGLLPQNPSESVRILEQLPAGRAQSAEVQRLLDEARGAQRASGIARLIREADALAAQEKFDEALAILERENAVEIAAARERITARREAAIDRRIAEGIVSARALKPRDPKQALKQVERLRAEFPNRPQLETAVSEFIAAVRDEERRRAAEQIEALCSRRKFAQASAALAVAVERFGDDETFQQLRVRLASVAERPAPRRTAIWGGIAAAGVVIAVAGVWIATHRSPPASPEPVVSSAPASVPQTGGASAPRAPASGAAARPPAAAEGSLIVQTRVPEASVLLDGKARVQTDRQGIATLRDAPGRYRLAVAKPGYNQISQLIEIRPGATTRVDVTLTPVETAAKFSPPPEQTETTAPAQVAIAPPPVTPPANNIQQLSGAIAPSDTPAAPPPSSPPPSPLRQAAPLPRAQADETQAVRAAILQAASAFGRKDFTALASVWPGVNRQFAERFQDKNYSVRYELTLTGAPVIEGDSARATAHRTVETTYGKLHSTAGPANVVIQLRKVGGRWVIVDVQ
jgi:tetratricopeptide (TPR) repeat protein